MRAIAGDPKKNKLAEGMKRTFTHKDYELQWTSLPGLGWLFLSVCLSVGSLGPSILLPFTDTRHSLTKSAFASRRAKGWYCVWASIMYSLLVPDTWPSYTTAISPALCFWKKPMEMSPLFYKHICIGQIGKEKLRGWVTCPDSHDCDLRTGMDI